jgi:hypothetical protein
MRAIRQTSSRRPHFWRITASRGIVTTRPDAANGLTTLGVGEARDVLGISATQTAIFSGQTIDATTVLVKYTYAGDVDLDGTIDGDDYFQIDNGYSAQSLRYFDGDIDYNGSIDADDYFLIDSNYNKAQTPLSATVASELPESAVFASDDGRSAYRRLMEDDPDGVRESG